MTIFNSNSMSRKALILLVAIITILAFSTKSYSMEYTINSITIQNDLGEPIENKRLSLAIKSKENELLSSETILEDVQRIKKNFLAYQNIITKIEPINSDQVNLIFEIQLKRIVKSIRILMDVNGSRPENLRGQLSMYKGGIFDATNLKNDTDFLKKKLINFGYPKIEVENSVKLSRKGNGIDVSYYIKAKSKRILINNIKIRGNKFFRASTIKKVMKTKSRGFFLAQRPTFELFGLDEDIARITKHYSNNGFLNAIITQKYTIKKERYANIEITIQEGPQLFIENVGIYGNNILSETSIREIISLNDRTAYSESLVRKVLQKLREAYGERGHATAEVMGTFNPENSTFLIFIEEGLAQEIDKIKIEGNIKTKDFVILRELSFQEGERVNTKKISEALKKLKDTRLFKTVTINYAQKTEDTGDIIISIVEAQDTYIRLSLGTSSMGTAGDIEFGINNLFGTGRAFSLKAQKNKELLKLGLVYRAPHTLGNNNLTIDASYEDRELKEYDKTKVAVIAMLERKINDSLSIGIGARVEFYDLDKIGNQLMTDLSSGQENGSVLGLISTLFYSSETQDAANDFNGGVRMRMTLMPSFSNNDFYMRSFVRLMGHKAIATNKNGVSHVLRGRITLGYAGPQTPFHERFYAGGVGTLRGFKNRSLSAGNSEAGSNVLLSTEASYSFPIVTDKLKGVIFFEAASMGDRFKDIGDFRAVGGLGLRSNLKETFLGATLEAGIAIPIKKENGDQLKPFYFIFGEYDPAYDL